MNCKNNSSTYKIFQWKKPPTPEGFLQKFYNNNGIRTVTVTHTHTHIFMLSLKSSLVKNEIKLGHWWANETCESLYFGKGLFIVRYYNLFEKIKFQ